MNPEDLPIGLHRDDIILSFAAGNVRLAPEIRLPVTALVEADVYTEPQSLYFGGVKAGTEKTMRLTMHGKGKERLTALIATVEPESPFSVTDTAEQGDVIFDITCKPGGAISSNAAKFRAAVKYGSEHYIIEVPIIFKATSP